MGNTKIFSGRVPSAASLQALACVMGLAGLATLTGCDQKSAASASTVSCSTCSAQVTVSTPITIYTPSPSPSPSASDTSDLTPALQFTVRGVGYNEADVTVTTRKKLKVVFEPLMQDSFVYGTGYSPQYSKMGVYVVVGAQSQATPMLSNQMASGGATHSNSLDFSTQIPKTCAASDAACVETVTIRITKPNYDYWCYNFPSYCASYPWTQVYSTHPWVGQITVGVDGTKDP